VRGPTRTAEAVGPNRQAARRSVASAAVMPPGPFSRVRAAPQAPLLHSRGVPRAYRPHPVQPRPRPWRPPECLHGYWELDDNSTTPPTLFPQPLAMAAAFDRDLVSKVFDAISTEMRAKSNEEWRTKRRHKCVGRGAGGGARAAARLRVRGRRAWAPAARGAPCGVWRLKRAMQAAGRLARAPAALGRRCSRQYDSRQAHRSLATWF
jgi:hypothetical protein